MSTTLPVMPTTPVTPTLPVTPIMPTTAQPSSALVHPIGSLSSQRVTLIIGLTIFIALALYYFVGVDEGMTSVFGKSMVVHEWVHDSRHFLGFPCH